jgi:hypothetical protein
LYSYLVILFKAHTEETNETSDSSSQLNQNGEAVTCKEEGAAETSQVSGLNVSTTGPSATESKVTANYTNPVKGAIGVVSPKANTLINSTSSLTKSIASPSKNCLLFFFSYFLF